MALLDRVRGRLVYLDTNVFVYALNAFPPFVEPLAELLRGVDDGSVRAATSQLTLMESLVLPFRNRDAHQEDRCRMILRPRSGLQLLPVSLGILETAARLRAESPSLRTPDAIHLATALQAGCEALLTNDQHFAGSHDIAVLLLSEWSEAIHED